MTRSTTGTGKKCLATSSSTLRTGYRGWSVIRTAATVPVPRAGSSCRSVCAPWNRPAPSVAVICTPVGPDASRYPSGPVPAAGSSSSSTPPPPPPPPPLAAADSGCAAARTGSRNPVEASSCAANSPATAVAAEPPANRTGVSALTW